MVTSKGEHPLCVELRIGVRLVPEKSEHAPRFALADELDRVHAAAERFARALVAPRLVQAPDLCDVAETFDRARDLELEEARVRADLEQVLVIARKPAGSM